MFDLMHPFMMQIAAFGDHMSAILADIDFDNITKKGDNNVMGLVKKVYVWVVIIWIIVALATKQFRQAIIVLIMGGIVGVFIYAPKQIESLGSAILNFFGVN